MSSATSASTGGPTVLESSPRRWSDGGDVEVDEVTLLPSTELDPGGETSTRLATKAGTRGRSLRSDPAAEREADDRAREPRNLR